MLGVTAILVAGSEVAGRRIRPLQCDRETPRSWMQAGPLRRAVRNGAALGLGATTRIGFWLWYVVPVSAIVCGRPDVGALVYGSYGATRGLAVWGIIYGVRRARWRNWQQWLASRNSRARLVTAQALLGLGLAITIAVGL
jgi:hypothetical protein